MQQFINDIFSNAILCNSVLAWIAAQLLKWLITGVTTGRFAPERFLGPGGMPSSHAAVMCALTTSVGQVKGIASADFAIAFIVTWVVVYDAIGVRWNAGLHAKTLNKLIDIIGPEMKDEPENLEKLQEVLGHKPIEVIVGALLGITIGLLMPV